MNDKIDTIAKQLYGFSETPRLDALIFCQYCPDPSLEQIFDFIERRKKGEPVSKIVGKRGFWKKEFYVTKDVLDPRPDSETLIEAVLSDYSDHNQKLGILDIGTGSGCLILTLLSEYPNAHGIGVDRSSQALDVARKNQENLNVEWAQLDFFEKEWNSSLGKFDIIVSNPPYIKSSDIPLLDTAVRIYDPLMALDGGADGLEAYRALSRSMGSLLNKGGMLYLEIGLGQEKDVVSIMQRETLKYLRYVKDLNGIIRVLVFQKVE